MKLKETFIDPLVDNNPITRQVLGICSALAVTVKVEQALVMTLALKFVVTMSNTIISLFRKNIPSSIRIIVQLTVISTLVSLIDIFLGAYLYDVSKSLSVFVTANTSHVSSHVAFFATIGSPLQSEFSKYS